MHLDFLRGSEVAWIKVFLHFMENQLKIDLCLRSIDDEINFVTENDIKECIGQKLKRMEE